MLRQLKRTAVRATATTVGLGVALEVTTHLPSEGRSSEFYHTLSDGIVMPLVRLCLDPEQAHNLAIDAAKAGWAPTYRSLGRAEDGWRVQMDSRPFGSSGAGGGDSNDVNNGRGGGGGLVFPNPVGLAAGFDKDGVAVKGLLELGFG